MAVPYSGFLFFYRKESPFSQFHSCTFEVDGNKFNCAEQYMMYSKAMLFGDTTIAKKILSESVPPKIKSLGRKVSPFDQLVWDDNKCAIVKKGSTAKFTQSEELRRQLLETAPKLLVEASPGDKIWGIGLSEENAMKVDPNEWKGKNLLGKILTEVRQEMLGEPWNLL